MSPLEERTQRINKMNNRKSFESKYDEIYVSLSEHEKHAQEMYNDAEKRTNIDSKDINYWKGRMDMINDLRSIYIDQLLEK